MPCQIPCALQRDLVAQERSSILNFGTSDSQLVSSALDRRAEGARSAIEGWVSAWGWLSVCRDEGLCLSSAAAVDGLPVHCCMVFGQWHHGHFQQVHLPEDGLSLPFDSDVDTHDNPVDPRVPFD